MARRILKKKRKRDLVTNFVLCHRLIWDNYFPYFFFALISWSNSLFHTVSLAMNFITTMASPDVLVNPFSLQGGQGTKRTIQDDVGPPRSIGVVWESLGKYLSPSTSLSCCWLTWLLEAHSPPPRKPTYPHTTLTQRWRESTPGGEFCLTPSHHLTLEPLPTDIFHSGYYFSSLHFVFKFRNTRAGLLHR